MATKPEISFSHRSLCHALRGRLTNKFAAISLLRLSHDHLAKWIARQLIGLGNICCTNARYKTFAIYRHGSWRRDIDWRVILRLLARSLEQAVRPKKIDNLLATWRSEMALEDQQDQQRVENSVHANLEELGLISKSEYPDSSLADEILHKLCTVRIAINFESDSEVSSDSD